MKLKCEELTKTIMECFDCSLDNRFSTEKRREFLIQGKKLRDSLVNLLSAEFKEGTSEVVEANESIGKVNAKLKEKDRVLSNIASVSGDIARLVSILDDLLKLAVSFI
jgi:hypothetical protein